MGTEENITIPEGLSYMMHHRLLRSLRICNWPSRGLLHVNDEVFEFFLKLHNCVQRLVTPDAFHLAGDNIQVARGNVFNNDELIDETWMDLSEDDDDNASPMLTEIYDTWQNTFSGYLLSYSRGLAFFQNRNSSQEKKKKKRKRKKTLRSKMTALSERKETGAKKPRVKK